MTDSNDTIRFDVLVRPAGTETAVTTDNIDDFKPNATDIETCYRWFVSHGIICHKTDFGLAGETSRSKFEEIFNTRLSKSGRECDPPPQSPSEISALINQITISRDPEFF
jgi:hypothetical protein